MHKIWWISICFGSKKLPIFTKKLLNDLFTYFSFYFAIFECMLFECMLFECMLFHQIVFKTYFLLPRFLYHRLYHRLDLRWFQGCPIFTFCVGCTEKAKKASFLLNFNFFNDVFASQKCIISQIRYNCPKSRWFLVEIGKNGPNFQCNSWKNIGVLKCISGVKLPKYTRHFNTVSPPLLNLNFSVERRDLSCWWRYIRLSCTQKFLKFQAF